MALRELTIDGVEWQVWDVVPGTSMKSANRHTAFDMPSGWLVLQCEQEKRRIVPTPKGWEEWSDAELVEAIKGAEIAPPHR